MNNLQQCKAHKVVGVMDKNVPHDALCTCKPAFKCKPWIPLHCFFDSTNTCPSFLAYWSSDVNSDVRVPTKPKKGPHVTCDLLTLSLKLGTENQRAGVSEQLAGTEQSDIRDPFFLSKLLSAKKTPYRLKGMSEPTAAAVQLLSHKNTILVP